MSNRNQTSEFIDIMTKMTPEQFFGLCKFFGLKVLTENVDPETKKAIPKPAEQLMLECAEVFESCNRFQRRNIMKQLKESFGGK